MYGRIKAVVTIVAAAGMIAGALAQVAPQTTQDAVSADGKRLVINGKPLFISGMNIAWVDFGKDVGDKPLGITAFTNYIKQIKMAGGNAVRWWLHTDAQSCPKINSEGVVTGLGDSTIANMRRGLDTAYAYGVVVSMCLFSFDLLKSEEWKANPNNTSYNIENNHKFLTDPKGVESYIEKGLKPILAAIGNHPAVMCWEVFNEPEGMLASNASGWGLQKSIAYSDIIRFTAKIAAEVHKSTLKMASTGIHEYRKTEYFPEYTDAKLKAAAGGDDKAYLDFYMVHHYPEWNPESPFKNNPSYWGLDRPILIGEFPARDWSPQGKSWTYNMSVVDAYEAAYDRGYLGAMSWSMTEEKVNTFGNYETTKPALENLYAKHKADIEVNNKEVDVPTGDMALKLTMTNLPMEGPDGPWNHFSKEEANNFAGKTNFSFEMYIENGSDKNLMIVPVIQTGTGFDWCAARTAQFMLTDKPQGEWFTVTVPISAFVAEEGKQVNPADVKGIFIQYFAKEAPYTGTVYFDNIKVDETVLYNFNDFGSEWNTAATGASISLAKRPGTSPVTHRAAIGNSNKSRAPIATVKGKILSISAAAGGASAASSNSALNVKLVNLKGKAVANFKTANGSGGGRFELTKIPAGSYIVEMSAASTGKRVGSSRVVVR